MVQERFHGEGGEDARHHAVVEVAGLAFFSLPQCPAGSDPAVNIGVCGSRGLNSKAWHSYVFVERSAHRLAEARQRCSQSDVQRFVMRVPSRIQILCWPVTQYEE